MSVLRVRLHANWGPDIETREFFNRYAPAADYRWRDLELTLSDTFDRLIVFNHPRARLLQPHKAILFECETAPLREGFSRDSGHWTNEIPVAYRTSEHFNFPGWSVASTYAQLMNHALKDRTLSAVISGKTWLPRQRTRLEFVRGRLAELPLDHFGRDGVTGPSHRGEVADKGAALLPYKYTFAAENFIERNYFTEKIHDAIVCECLAFYDGCPNLDSFLHRDCFMPVDASRPAEAMAAIKEAISNGEWERRLPVIREQKHRLMRELNPLEIIRKAIRGDAVLWRRALP